MHKIFKLIDLGPEMHHCASIAIKDDEYYLSFYYGQECTDNQHVVVMRGNTVIAELGPKTGNPLIYNKDGVIYLIYSVFEDKDEYGNTPEAPVDRWQYCSNHLAIVNEDSIQYVGSIPGSFGLLARAAPLYYDNKVLLPLYREKDPRCELWVHDDSIRFKSSFGEISVQDINKMNAYVGRLGIGVAIQPTFYISDNGKLTALCRNVSRSHKYAWECVSDDFGETWGDIKQSNIINMNSSLVYMSGEEKYEGLLLNTSRQRAELMMHNSQNDLALNIAQAIDTDIYKKSYSYPNYAWDGDNLHVVHTNCRKIAHHIFTKGILDAIYGLKDSKKDS